MYSVLQKKCNMGWETYNLKSCTHFKGYKRTLESVLILPRSIHTRTPKISYPGAPSSYAEKLAKGKIEGKKSARGKPGGVSLAFFVSV